MGTLIYRDAKQTVRSLFDQTAIPIALLYCPLRGSAKVILMATVVSGCFLSLDVDGSDSQTVGSQRMDSDLGKKSSAPAQQVSLIGLVHGWARQVLVHKFTLTFPLLLFLIGSS